MKKKYVSKLTVLAITGTICTSVLTPSITVFANEIKPIKMEYNNSIESILKKENISEKEWNNFINVVRENSITDVNSQKERGIAGSVAGFVKNAFKYLIKHVDIIPSKTMRDAIKKYGNKIISAIDTIESWTWYGIARALIAVGIPDKYADAAADFIVTWLL